MCQRLLLGRVPRLVLVGAIASMWWFGRWGSFGSHGGEPAGDEAARPSLGAAEKAEASEEAGEAGAESAPAKVEEEDTTDRNIDRCTQAIRENPNDAEAYRLRFAAYLHKARSDLDAILRLSPTDREALRARAAVNSALGEKARAEADLAKAAAVKEMLARLEAIERWQAPGVNWLDSLGEIAARLPARQQLVLTKVTCTASAEGGTLTLDGFVRDPATAVRVQTALAPVVSRSQFGQIASAQGQVLPWQFSLGVKLRAQPPGGEMNAEREGPKLRMARLRRQSLPRDADAARRLYQMWLLKTLNRADLDDFAVAPMLVRRHPGGEFNELGFNVRGRASVEALTTCLWQFYALDRLHQIRRLQLTFRNDLQEVDLAMTLAALSLDDADAADRLSVEDSETAESRKVDDYVKALRRLTAPAGDHGASGDPGIPSTADEAPSQRTQEAPDPLRSTYVTAIIFRDGSPEIWLHARTTDKRLRLRAGDTFEVGTTKGRVVRVDRQKAVLELAGQQYVVSLGENLREGKPVQP